MLLRAVVISSAVALCFVPSEAYPQPQGSKRLLLPRISPAPESVIPVTRAVLAGTHVRSGPTLKEGEIREETLKDDRSAVPASPGLMPPEIVSDVPPLPGEAEEAQSSQGETGDTAGEGSEGNSTAALSEEGAFRELGKQSLLAKITPETSARRAASLRLAEEGRRLLASGDYESALERLEKSIALDSTNAYSYYYLAKVHYYQAQYQQSFNFLDVAESLMSTEPSWLARVFALRGKNFQALGFFERTDASYASALKLDPNNEAALEGITRIEPEAMTRSR